MPNRFTQLLRQYLLVALMAFTLVAVQVMQASPLHDHTRHTVDCALCHLQFSDDALVVDSFTVPFRASVATVAAVAPQLYASASPSPYQGRAPPRLFS